MLILETEDWITLYPPEYNGGTYDIPRDDFDKDAPDWIEHLRKKLWFDQETKLKLLKLRRNI